jgi:hypothetical protein
MQAPERKNYEMTFYFNKVSLQRPDTKVCRDGPTFFGRIFPGLADG